MLAFLRKTNRLINGHRYPRMSPQSKSPFHRQWSSYMVKVLSTSLRDSCAYLEGKWIQTRRSVFLESLLKIEVMRLTHLSPKIQSFIFNQKVLIIAMVWNMICVQVSVFLYLQYDVYISWVWSVCMRVCVCVIAYVYHVLWEANTVSCSLWTRPSGCSGHKSHNSLNNSLIFSWQLFQRPGRFNVLNTTTHTDSTTQTIENELKENTLSQQRDKNRLKTGS